jgi:hypothetical protein
MCWMDVYTLLVMEHIGTNKVKTNTEVEIMYVSV